MDSAGPSITLCICTYDRYDLLPKAIDSAARQSIPVESYRILVIDNSPDFERSYAFGKRFASIPNLDYVIEKTPGLSNARNVAARRSVASIIAFMDDDAIASPAWAEEILRAFEQFGPKAMIVGGRVDPMWSLPRPAWIHDSMLGSLSIIDWGGEARVASEDEWVAGTNIAFRVSAILDHGGFSTNLGRIGSGSSLLSNEEVQLLERIRSAGSQVIYAPKALVNHLVEPKRLTRSWFRKRAAWQAFSDFMMRADVSAVRAKDGWPALVAYFNALPPLERTIRGLLYDTDDPDLFHWQTGAIYTMTSLLLAGFEGLKVD
jgi:GT2 family glycosyltransferase